MNELEIIKKMVVELIRKSKILEEKINKYKSADLNYKEEEEELEFLQEKQVFLSTAVSKMDNKNFFEVIDEFKLEYVEKIELGEDIRFYHYKLEFLEEIKRDFNTFVQ